MESPRHVPVLLEEVLELLAPAEGELVVDGTLGAGGHSEAFLRAGARVLAFDRDPVALRLAGERLAPFGERFTAVEGDFRTLGDVLDSRGIAEVDVFFADLGVSSMQLDDPERGFSFRADGPLDMRMSGTGQTGADIVNSYGEQELVRVFREYGEEPMARAIARRIVRRRGNGPIATTGELARLVAEVKGRSRKPGIDPSTQIFQAIRIEVNRELEGLDTFLEGAIERLRPGGRIGVVAFHSLEDRVVKHTLRKISEGCRCAPGLPVCVCGRRRVLEILTKRPVRPSAAEAAANPRSRSARFRVARRVAP